MKITKQKTKWDNCIKQIKGEKAQMEEYIVDKGSWMYGVNSYLKNIDLLDFFIINTKESN